MSKSNGLSHLLTAGVVSFTRYSLLPWCLWNLYQRKYNSWTQAVPRYGFLLASLQAGHAIGQLLVNLNFTSSFIYSSAFLSLTSSYINLCFVDRYSLQLILFFFLGCSGSLLSGVSINLDRSVSNIAFVKKPNDNELNSNLERVIICFMFSTLLSGYLYDTSPLARFPVLKLAMLIVSGCFLLGVYFCCINRVVNRKWKSTTAPLNNAVSSNGSSGSNEKKNKDQQVIPCVNYTGPVPNNFMRWYGNDLAAAQKAYGKRIQWRIDENIDTILTTPQPGFHEILKYYPHCIHGYSYDGCAVVYEMLGRGSPKDLIASGVTMDMLVRHFMLRNELIFERLLDPAYVAEFAKKHPGVITSPLPVEGDTRRLMSVLDVKGVGMGSVTSDILYFISTTGAIIDNYYPFQVERLVVYNAPSWFSMIWSAIAVVLPASIKKKVDISYDSKGLDKYIHPSMRPVSYGGTSEIQFGQEEGHLAFMQLEQDWKTAPGTASGSQIKTQTGSSGDGKAKDSKSSSANNSSNQSSSTAQLPGGAASQSSSGGVLGWFKKLTGSGGGNSTPKTAFLGEKNSFRYNSVSGNWELDFDSGEDEQSRLLRGHEEEQEEDYDTIVVFGDDNSGGNSSRNRNSSRNNSSSGSNSRTTRNSSNSTKIVPIKHNTSTDLSHSRSTDSHDIHNDNHNYGKTSSRSGNDVSGNRKSSSEKSHRSKKQRNSSSSKSLPASVAALTPEQLEDHGMLLAIQASHDAKNYSPRKSSSGHHNSQLNSSFSRSNSYAVDLESGGAAAKHDSHHPHHRQQHNPADNSFSRVSSDIFLMVTVMHLIAALMQGLVCTLLPVWLLSPVSGGGLSYGVQDLALVLSTTAMFVLLLHVYFTNRLEFCLKASPVRSLRIGCGVVIMLCFLLPMYMHLTTFDTSVAAKMLGPGHAAGPHSVYSAHDHDEHSVVMSVQDSHVQIPKDMRHHIYADNVNHNPPTRAFFTLLMTSAVLSVLVSAAHVTRKATNILFHLTLSSSFTSPVAMRSIVNHLLDISAPVVSTLIHAGVFGRRLRYPMDSAFFLSLAACSLLVVYIGSIFLSVQFRGDYGVMTDASDATTPSSGNRGTVYDANSGQQMRARRDNSSGNGGSNSSFSHQHQQNKEGGLTAQDVFCIPMGDLNLLFSQIGYSYGSKLYNLRDDFKDL